MDCDIRLSHPALSCLRHSHFELRDDGVVWVRNENYDDLAKQL